MATKTLKSAILLVAVLITANASAQSDPETATAGNPSVNDFKITMLSLGSGSSRFTYERAFDPRHSAEFTLGIIGMGWDWMNDTHSEGLLVKLAYKWLLLPQRSANSWLAGFYVKPEFVITHFDYRPSDAAASAAQTTFQGALLAECGYQLVWHWFLLDVYAGIGPSVGTGNDNNYFHSFMLFPEGGPLAFTAGYRIGVAF